MILAWLTVWALAAPAAPAVAPTERLNAAGRAVVGEAAPWFAGWTPDGRVLNRTKVLSRPGKAHALVLFATWCKPCEVGLKALAGHRAELAKAGVTVTLVAVGEAPEVVQPWLAARALGEVPLLIDKFGAASQALAGQAGAEGGAGTLALPRTVVLAPDGTVKAIFGREGPDYIEALRATARP